MYTVGKYQAGIRNLLLIPLCLLIFVARPARAIQCPEAFVKLAKVSTKALGTAALHTGTIVFPPALFPVHYYRERNRARAEGRPTQTSVIAMHAAARMIPHLKVFAILSLLAAGTGNSLSEFHQFSSEFDEEAGSEGTVVLDFFDEDDPVYAEGGRQAFDTLYAGSRASFSPSSDRQPWLWTLKAIAEKSGPLDHVDTYGHGLAATMLGDYTSAFDVQEWARQRSKGEPLEVFRFVNEEAEKATVDPDKVFADSFMVRLNSCFVGSGVEGLAFLNDLGHALAGSEKTAVLYASKYQVYPNVVELTSGRMGVRPPDFCRQLGDLPTRPVMAIPTFVSAGNLGGTAAMPWSLDKSVRLKITPAFADLRSEIHMTFRKRLWVSVEDGPIEETEELVTEAQVRPLKPLIESWSKKVQQHYREDKIPESWGSGVRVQAWRNIIHVQVYDARREGREHFIDTAFREARAAGFQVIRSKYGDDEFYVLPTKDAILESQSIVKSQWPKVLAAIGVLSDEFRSRVQQRKEQEIRSGRDAKEVELEAQAVLASAAIATFSTLEYELDNLTLLKSGEIHHSNKEDLGDLDLSRSGLKYSVDDSY